MDDSALIRFFRRSGPVLRSASLLTAIAATDLASEDPSAEVALVGASLAWLADAALEASLALAKGVAK